MVRGNYKLSAPQGEVEEVNVGGIANNILAALEEEADAEEEEELSPIEDQAQTAVGMTEEEEELHAALDDLLAHVEDNIVHTQTTIFHAPVGGPIASSTGEAALGPTLGN